jgi:putative membrane protein
MSPKAKEFLSRWVVTTLAVLVAAHIVPGIRYETTLGLLVASFVLGILNAVLRPILTILALPLVLVTLGLFMLVINAALLFLVGRMVNTFHVDSFGAAFWGAVVMSLVSLVLNLVAGRRRAKVQFQWKRTSRGHRPPSGPLPPGGPFIDV